MSLQVFTLRLVEVNRKAICGAWAILPGRLLRKWTRCARNDILIGLFLYVIFVMPTSVFASPNNKFGISLLQPTDDDIKMAAELVNGNGGDYGYVTLVIQENDRSVSKWQDVFEKLREHHLIPIIRLATKPDGEYWRRPTADDAGEWATFLDSLNWITEKRYIVLFNEPNHASEWGGEVDPKNYGEVAATFAKRLHEKNKDFFVMPAGLDGAAPSSRPLYEDEEIFLFQMLTTNYQLLSTIDGWSSHSYPNPAFSGSPHESGKKSIRGYQWELELLRSLGLTKDLPVFITETGWVSDRLSRETIATYFRIAYETVWGPDDRVVAVTPFVFNYQSEPFLNFSWKRQGSSEFYPQYYSVWSLTKTKGEPEIRESGLVWHQLPHEFVANSNYTFVVKIKNTGQAIWDAYTGYSLAFEGDDLPFTFSFSPLERLKPMQDSAVKLHIKTRVKEEGSFATHINLLKKDMLIARTTLWQFSVLPLPSLRIEAPIFPKLHGFAKGAQVEIYDDKESLIFKKDSLSVVGGVIQLDEVQNVVLGRRYRLVIVLPYYVPRQSYVMFEKGLNKATIKQLLPLDLNRNGKWEWGDASELFKNPGLLRLFIP